MPFAIRHVFMSGQIQVNGTYRDRAEAGQAKELYGCPKECRIVVRDPRPAKRGRR